jgi:L-asparaginase
LRNAGQLSLRLLRHSLDALFRPSNDILGVKTLPLTGERLRPYECLSLGSHQLAQTRENCTITFAAFSGACVNSTLPRIAVIGTGGTISSLGASSLDVLDYPDFGRKLSAEALLDRFPETRLVAEPMPVTVRQVGSTEIGPTEWLELRALIHQIAGDEPATAGFVITHGTATLEETAFFLNLSVGVGQPVVLVGAQRPASALGTDAGMNLVNALRVAGAAQARGKGVLVLLNDEISAARDVVKTSTYRLQTFRSLDFGALGHVDGDGVHFYRAPLGAHMPEGPFAGRELKAPLPRVDIVYSYAGADGALIDAAVATGARGLVSAGFAPGSPTPDQRAAFERAIAGGVVVVQCSRAASGRVAPRRRLRETGVVAGCDLSPQKARILLMLALTGTTDIATIQQLFQSC